MSRKLIAVNVLLLALIGLAGWRMYQVGQARLTAQRQFLSQAVQPAPAPVLALPEKPQPATPAAYIQVAQELMFSRDRNPTVVIDTPPPKPMPALPRYYGMMNFGEGPRVVLAPAPGQAQRTYRVGERIGEFKLAAVSVTGLVFEWDGKQVPARFGELKDDTPAPETTAESKPAAQETKPAKPVTTVSSAALSRPGVDIGTSVKGCQPGDTSPPGTVADGYRKVVTETPFGKSCRWEKIQ